jgi:hypothetical protein
MICSTRNLSRAPLVGNILFKKTARMRVVDSFFFDGRSFDILSAALAVAGGRPQRASQARSNPI